MILTFSKPQFEERIRRAIKIHTFRQDIHDRWKVGMAIQFWRGSPRNRQSYQFGAGQVAEATRMTICPEEDMITLLGIEIICPGILKQFAIDDGFDSWEDMKQFFPKQVDGKLISWRGCSWFPNMESPYAQ